MEVAQYNERLERLRTRYAPLWYALLTAIEENPQGFSQWLRALSVTRIPSPEDIVARAIIAIQTAQKQVSAGQKSWKSYDYDFDSYVGQDRYDSDYVPIDFETLNESLYEAGEVYGGNLESFVSHAYHFALIPEEGFDEAFDNIFGDAAKAIGKGIGGIFKGIGKAIKKKRDKKKKAAKGKAEAAKTQALEAKKASTSAPETTPEVTPDAKAKEKPKSKTWLYVGIGGCVLLLIVVLYFVFKKK